MKAWWHFLHIFPFYYNFTKPLVNLELLTVDKNPSTGRHFNTELTGTVLVNKIGNKYRIEILKYYFLENVKCYCLDFLNYLLVLI